MGFAADGDSVLVARENSLERIDPMGVTVRLAGEEYRACPGDPSARWRPSSDPARFNAAFLSVRDGVLTLADSSCGVWSRNLATGSSTMLASKDGGVDWPAWTEGSGPVVAVEGADVLVCFTGRHSDRTMTEVWSVARDGSQRRRLAELPEAEGCGAVLADEAAVFVAAPAQASSSSPSSDVLLRVDRRDGTVTRLAEAISLGGITQDQDSIYFIDDGEVARITKASGERTTLEARGARTQVEGSSTLGSTPRSGLLSDGTFLYWLGTRLTGTDFRNTIERRRIAGGEPETVYDVLGSSPRDALWPAPGIALHNNHVYFVWWKMDPADQFSVARVAK